MPRTQPCSKCGTPKMVGRGSREDVVCLPCRRTPEWRAMMLERQREWSRQRQRKLRSKKREAAGLPPKPPKVDQPCAVCEVMQPRKLCDAHRNWNRVTCFTCGVETYSMNRPSAKRNVYCGSCSPGARPGPLGPRGPRESKRKCRHCDNPLPGKRKACDNCLDLRPWERSWSDAGRLACNRCGIVRAGRRNCNPDTYTCHPCRREVSGRPAKPPMVSRAKPQPSSDYRRRAKRFGVEYEAVEKARVFNRDGWRCGICRGDIDKRLSYPHPMSASLDHVVPLSLGGGHLYVNTQAAHLQCNIAKGNRLAGDQLARIG